MKHPIQKFIFILLFPMVSLGFNTVCYNHKGCFIGLSNVHPYTQVTNQVELKQEESGFTELLTQTGNPISDYTNLKNQVVFAHNKDNTYTKMTVIDVLSSTTQSSAGTKTSYKLRLHIDKPDCTNITSC